MLSLWLCVWFSFWKVCFERSDGMGGLWKHKEEAEDGYASAMHCTTINSSKVGIGPPFTEVIVAQWHHIAQRSRSPLTQEMAYCLTAPSHYLNQYWLGINNGLWHSSESNFIDSAKATILYNEFCIMKFYIKLLLTSLSCQKVKAVRRLTATSWRNLEETRHWFRVAQLWLLFVQCSIVLLLFGLVWYRSIISF